MEYDIKDKEGWRFEDESMNQEYKDYMYKRNSQIAEFKTRGLSWKKIASKMSLSPDYVKDIAHKMGVQTPPTRKQDNNMSLF